MSLTRVNGAGIPPLRPDRIVPDEPPGIEPLPDEPQPLPDFPETAPPDPDTDQPGRCPEEYPGPQEGDPILPALFDPNPGSIA